jgi:hypothetical protein
MLPLLILAGMAVSPHTPKLGIIGLPSIQWRKLDAADARVLRREDLPDEPGARLSRGGLQAWSVRMGWKPARMEEASTILSLFVHNHHKGHLFHGSNLAFPGPHILHGNLRLPWPDRLKSPELLSPRP